MKYRGALGIGESYDSLQVDVISSKMRYREFSEKVRGLLRFPAGIIEKSGNLKSKLVLEKFSVTYIKGDTLLEEIYSYKSQENLDVHLEGPENLVLFYEDVPLCVVAFKKFKDFILIKQLQGVGLGVKDKSNFYLDGLNWEEVLVRIIEEYCKINGQKGVCILPVTHLPHLREKQKDTKQIKARKKQRHNRGLKIYDETAKNLGYGLTEMDGVNLKRFLGKWRNGYIYYKDIKKTPN